MNQFIFGIALVMVLNATAMSTSKDVCKIDYEVEVVNQSIQIEFSETIQPFRFELIEVRKGVIKTDAIIKSTSVRFDGLSSGEYFVRLYGIDCQLIIGSKKDRSSGLIIK